MERELDDSVSVDVPDHAVRLRGGSEVAVADTTSADDELADPGRRGDLIRGLGIEPLVVVVVTVQHDLRSGRVQVPPERVVLGAAPVASGREPALVPVGEGA